MRNFTCHSGGAVGADQCFEEIALQYNCQVINYSYRTLHHKNINKYELTNEEFLEGCKAVEVVAEQLKRYRYKPYINLLARNFFQTKFAKQLFAVGILRADQNGVLVELEGGTGWSVQMAINMKREIYVFDQNRCKWFTWSYTKKTIYRI